MLKIELRKLAILVLSFAMVGVVAACSGSSSSSSKDQSLAALSYPASNTMGTYQFDVDPQAANVTVTPVGSPYSATKITGDGAGSIANITVSTLPGTTWNGADTISFNTKIYWNKAGSELHNIRLGVNASTNMNVSLLNYSKCTGQPWSSCLPGADPAVAYVADDNADKPVTYRACKPDGTGCLTNGKYKIHEACGSVTAHWVLQEGTATPYRFWANLYGDEINVSDVTADSRYDDSTGTIYLKTFKKDAADSTYPAEAAESNQMASGEWFYVDYYVEAFGARRALLYYDDVVNGPKTIEDTGNMAAWAGGTSSSANYWYVDNMGPMTIRFDPAIIEINSTDAVLDPPGNGLNKFSASTGTKLQVISNGTTVGWTNQTSAYQASNKAGFFKQLSASFASSPVLYPTPGDGARGLVGVTWNYGYVSLRAKTGLAVGAGSAISYSYDSNSIIGVYRTDMKPYAPAAGTPSSLPRSLNWPTLCDALPDGGCGGFFAGAHNVQNTYICIQ